MTFKDHQRRRSDAADWHWLSRNRISTLGVLALATSVLIPPAAVLGQEATTFFRQNCLTCHTVGAGRMVGPDLKGVTSRRDRNWLIKFIQNPKAVIAGGDAYAIKLRDEAHGVVMPAIPGMTPQLAEEILQLIEKESAASQHVKQAPAKVPDTPFTAADITRGAALFSGREPLAGGAPPCLSCHTTGRLPHLGGGRLGPDLSRAFERLYGRKGLTAWLSAPPTVTMRAIFEERPVQAADIRPLVAFLEASSKKGTDDHRPQGLELLLFGFGGLSVFVVAFDAIWKGRLRSVRRKLVEDSQTRGDI